MEMIHMENQPLNLRSGRACSAGGTALRGEALRALSDQLGPEWTVVSDHHLEREFSFPDFRSALAFTNRVGELAESEGHHPNIGLRWGRVKIEIWTHKVGGLTESDFILAAKINALPQA